MRQSTIDAATSGEAMNSMMLALVACLFSNFPKILLPENFKRINFFQVHVTIIYRLLKANVIFISLTLKNMIKKLY